MLRICSAGLYLAFIDVRTLCALWSAIINQEIIEFFGLTRLKFLKPLVYLDVSSTVQVLLKP